MQSRVPLDPGKFHVVVLVAFRLPLVQARDSAVSLTIFLIFLTTRLPISWFLDFATVLRALVGHMFFKCDEMS